MPITTYAPRKVTDKQWAIGIPDHIVRKHCLMKRRYNVKYVYPLIIYTPADFEGSSEVITAEVGK